MSAENVLNTNSFSKELQVMIKVLKGNYTEIDSSIDWNRFIELVMHHRVYPNIYTELSNSRDAVPAYVIESLKKEYFSNALKMLQLTGEMKRITQALTDCSIRSIQLKGPILAKHLYGDISCRTSKDLDILVSEKDLQYAEKVLLELGYIEYSEVPRILNDYKKKSHHISFIHPGKQIMIEVHWRLNKYSESEPAFEELWKRSKEYMIENTAVYSLGNEDLYVYLIQHGARHGWFRIRWLVDMVKLSQSEMDWNKINARLLNKEDKNMVGQCILLISELFDVNIPSELSTGVKNKKTIVLANSVIPFIRENVNMSPKPNRKDLEVLYKRYMFRLHSKKIWFNQALLKLYPSSLDARALPLPQQFHFIYFILRPVLWMYRKYVRVQKSSG